MKNKFIIHLTLAFVKITGFLPALLFFKPKVHYKNKTVQGHRLPAPAILVSNHKSLMDFALYLILFPFRSIRFLMAEVLFQKGKFFSGFLYALGGIYVNRNTYDFGFVSEALNILDHSETVGIFPEGRLPVDGKPFPFTSSTVYIALKTSAPIIPVYTDGSYGIKKRTNVVIGEPIYLREKFQVTEETPEVLEKLTRYLESEVRSLEGVIR